MTNDEIDRARGLEMTDYGHPCGENRECTLPNVHCAYPNCYKGRKGTSNDDIDAMLEKYK